MIMTFFKKLFCRSHSRQDEEAARWFVRQQSSEITVAERNAFDAWQKESVSNKNAYDAFVQDWAGTSEYIEASHAFSAMREEALARRQSGFSLTYKVAMPVAACCLLLLVGWAYNARFWEGKVVQYYTEVGERRTVSLQDGTEVTLNTDTVLSVQYGTGQRKVNLLKGQAWFDVAKDQQARPFTVTYGYGSVTALGTVFDVYRRQDQSAQVTLVEGSIRVQDAVLSDEAKQKVVLTVSEDGPKRQIIQHEKSGLSSPIEVSYDEAFAWQNAVVILKNQSLSYAVEEMNRYSQQKILFENEALKKMHLSGIFHTRDRDVFLQVVGEYLPVNIVYDLTGNAHLYAQALPENTK